MEDAHSEHEIAYCEKHDCYYCVECDEWVESKCDDPECEYCTTRPARPSDVKS